MKKKIGSRTTPPETSDDRLLDTGWSSLGYLRPHLPNFTPLPASIPPPTAFESTAPELKDCGAADCTPPPRTPTSAHASMVEGRGQVFGDSAT